MNQRVTLKSLADAVAVPRKSRFNPRLEILDEVVAGFLWMQLDLPEDTSRSELESFAHRLVAHIRAGRGARSTPSTARITGNSSSANHARPQALRFAHPRLFARILCEHLRFACEHLTQNIIGHAYLPLIRQSGRISKRWRFPMR